MKKGTSLTGKECSKVMSKGVMSVLTFTKKILTRSGFRPPTWAVQPGCRHYNVPNLMAYSSNDFSGNTIKWLCELLRLLATAKTLFGYSVFYMDAVLIWPLRVVNGLGFWFFGSDICSTLVLT